MYVEVTKCVSIPANDVVSHHPAHVMLGLLHTIAFSVIQAVIAHNHNA